MIDREEHAAQAAGLEQLDVDPLRENSHLTSADEPLLSRLGQKRLADREQYDHHGHPEAIPQQQKQRSPRS